ncbi:MAG: antibiotic biosynthesis monooxygenase [Pseudomonadales bacterium]
MNQQNSQSQDGPLTALVEYQIRAETTTVQQWLDVWGMRAEDAFLAEPETCAYEAAISAENEQRVLIFERYAEGESSIHAHTQRPAHTALMETMGAKNMTKRRVMSNLYADVDNYGWWQRPERDAAMRDADLLVTLIGTRFPSAEMKQRYIELTGAHAAYCWETEPGTLVYSAGIALRDADRGPEIKAGDLVFVAVFANEEAAAEHRDDPQHVALQPKLAEIKRERVMLQSYRTSGKGFLWASK